MMPLPGSVLAWLQAGGIVTPAGTAPQIPLPDQSAIYIDAADASLGAVSSLTARGSWAQVFANVAGTGAIAAMEADGLALNGYLLRGSMSRGPFTRMTMLLDVTRNAAPLAGAGELVNINSNGAAGIRFWLRYTSSGFNVVGPNGVTITYAPIGGYGARQVIAAELDLTAGLMTAVDADGETQSAAVTPGGISVTRIEIGKACLCKLHRLAIVMEA